MAVTKRWQVQARRGKNLLEHLLNLHGMKEADLELDFNKLHSPFLLPDMKKAVAITQEAVANKWPVAIFGDYDADGTPAAALLYRGLRKLGLKVVVELPKREAGYGLRPEYVERLAQKAKLLITVDTGVASVEEVTLAQKLGMKVIILDHHLPKDILPPADALVDVFIKGSKYPFDNLCGCALAYKYLEALSSEFSELSEGFRKWLLDIVAISTVADMMYMKDENRILVHYGLKVLQKTRNPGLKALLNIMGVTPEKLSVYLLGFGLGPRLNAGGRMGDNRPALELLITDDPNEAQKWAYKIDRMNAERQNKVDEILNEAQQAVWIQNDRKDRVLTLVGQNWPVGIVGLVAGRLVQTFNRPVVVGTQVEDKIIGSARSISKYPIIDGLTQASKELLTFGGHRQAAGLSANTANWDRFCKSLKTHAGKILTARDLIPVILADAVLTEDEVNLTTVKNIEKMAPFGFGYPEPTFILPEVTISNLKIIGKNQDHLRAQAQIGARFVELVGFGMAGKLIPQVGQKWHLVGHLEANRWNGSERLQFRFLDYLNATENFETLPSDGQSEK